MSRHNKRDACFGRDYYLGYLPRLLERVDAVEQMAAALRAFSEVMNRWALDFADPHAHLPITEDADGLTCDICGAELADWPAADEHVEQHEGWAA